MTATRPIGERSTPDSSESREIATLHRLHHLMSQMNAGQDLDEVLQMVVEGVADIAGFAVAAISRTDVDGTLVMVAVAGSEDLKRQLLGRRLPMTEVESEFANADKWGILRFVPHDRLPQEIIRGWVPDIEPDDSPDAWHPLDALFAPITAPNGDLVGLLSVDLPHNGRRPEQSQRDILEMYTVQAGIAISNAEQRDRLREEVRLGAAMRAISRTAGTRLDLGSVIDESIAPIAESLRCTGALVRAFEGVGELPGRGYMAIHPEGVASVSSDEVLEICRRAAFTCWERQTALLLGPDIPPAADIVSFEEAQLLFDYVEAVGSRNILCVPMGVGPECLGYLILTRPVEAAPWNDAEVTAVLGIGKDIGRAMMHARLFERERVINEKLLELDRYKTELISTISHELKTPLTSILGHAEMMRTAETSPEVGRSVASIERNAERIRSLAEDLLLLSRVADPGRPVAEADVDLAELLGDTLEMLKVQSDSKHLTLVAEEPDGRVGPVAVRGEAAELGRVITNIVGNAVKFSRPNGTISLSLRRIGGEVVFHCADQGIGISMPDQERLFTEFFRSTNPEALAIPGTGLGLSIVKRIVDRHQGSISVLSTPGQGTRFTVRFPATSVEAPYEVPDQESVPLG